MQIGFTQQQTQLRRDLRTYFRDLMTPERVAATKGLEGGDVHRQMVRQMGKDGILTLGWPTEFGGDGRTTTDQLILFEEIWVARAPFPIVTISTIAPALMQHGTPAQQQEYLPGIASGEKIFAIGYSEPGSGTDLASLKTTATLEGDHYVVNGTKVFTSGANGADHIWLAARTDTEAKSPHHGISVMISDVADPGFSLGAIETVAGMRTNMTYYTDVKVGADKIVGGKNNGWRVIQSQLNHERIALAAMSINGVRCFLDILALARTENDHGKTPMDDPMIRTLAAKIYCRLEAMTQLNHRMAWQIETGRVDHALASGVKVFATMELVQVMREIMELAGPLASLRGGSAAAMLNGEIEEVYRLAQLNTFGGGAAEVMRAMVASTGLGMPNTIAG